MKILRRKREVQALQADMEFSLDVLGSRPITDLERLMFGLRGQTVHRWTRAMSNPGRGPSTVNSVSVDSSASVPPYTTTTSATAVAMGPNTGAAYSLSINLDRSGAVQIWTSHSVSNSTATDGSEIIIYRVYGAGTAPTGQAAATGAPAPGGVHVSATANAIGQIAIAVSDAPGVGTWTYYLAMLAFPKTTGTVSIGPAIAGGGGGHQSLCLMEVR